MPGKVAIVMGSKSDAETMKGAADMLTSFGVANETYVISAHRTPHVAIEFASKAEENGFEVIIAGAGMAAHLPGILAAITALPVIGVPTKSAALSGVDSLYSIVQMPTGIPVATVAIDGAKNAGILAVQILSVKYPELREAIKKHKEKLASAGAVRI
ncbi:5-(carboxyamino)imidazole ribonucleotide mutase [bacterium]|nr:5-(carboxyamino)imidazole ribonucleotide mutase [bacterium]